MNEAERGSLLPLLAVVLLVAATLVVAVGRLGEAAVARAHARAAADAAALAGAAESRAAAAASRRGQRGQPADLRAPWARRARHGAVGPGACDRARSGGGVVRAPQWRTVGSGRRSLTRSQRLPQGRRVRRVIRKVDPWTVLRFSVLFYLSILLVVLVAGFALWQVASATGVRDNAENFVGELVGAGLPPTRPGPSSRTATARTTTTASGAGGSSRHRRSAAWCSSWSAPARTCCSSCSTTSSATSWAGSRSPCSRRTPHRVPSSERDYPERPSLRGL